jgi:hypothetical protein
VACVRASRQANPIETTGGEGGHLADSLADSNNVAFGERQFRHVLGLFATGVAVVTANVDGGGSQPGHLPSSSATEPIRA